MLETLRISKYSNKVKIFDRCRQSAGNPLKIISGILEGKFLQKEEEKLARKKPLLSLVSREAIKNLQSEYKRLLEKGNNTEDEKELKFVYKEMDLLIEAIRKLEIKVSLYHSDFDWLGQA